MPFEKSVFVPLNADETFALITQPDRLRRWQVVTARVDLRAGGDYRWTIIPGHAVAGTFTEVDPGRRVVFTWGWEGSPDLPPGTSTVVVTLEPAEGGTMIASSPPPPPVTPDPTSGRRSPPRIRSARPRPRSPSASSASAASPRRITINPRCVLSST